MACIRKTIMPDLDEEKLESLKKELAKFKKGERLEKRARTTPLGKLFDEISESIRGYQSESDVISYLYSRFNPEGGQKDSVVKRKDVIDKLLQYLLEINVLSAKKKDSNIISIPLYDIRVVGELTNLIIIHGIYSILPNGILLPLEKRKLKNFRTPTTFTKMDLNQGKPILIDILSAFTKIFESSSDLRDLILVGTGFTDALSIAIFLGVTSGNEEYRNYVERLEKQSSTYQLLSFYSILLTNTRSNPEFSKFISSLLSRQLLKPNGVESLIDLALGLREDEEIDVAKIDSIVLVLLSSKPKDLGVVPYYKSIFSQIYSMLVLVNRPLMNTILVEIITIIYRKNKRIITDFLFSDIWNKLNPNLGEDHNDTTDNTIVLTSEVDLNNSFNVCLSISRNLNSSDQEIINDFFKPIIIPLWYYANYQRSQQKDYNIVLNLVKNIIILGDSDYFLGSILSNLVVSETDWTFANGENGLTYIKYNTNESTTSKENKILKLFDEIDFNVESFVKLTSGLSESDSEYTTKILIKSLNKLISNSELSGSDHPIQKIVYLKVIQSLLENFRSEIENSPVSLLIFVNTFLNQYFESVKSKSKLEIIQSVDSDDDDDDDDEIAGNKDGESDGIITTLIPILEILCTLSPSADDEKSQLQSLQHMLKSNAKYIPESISQQCQKVIDLDTKKSAVKPKHFEFNMETVLKQLNDPIPSIRVYALDKLTNYMVNSKDKEQKQISMKYTLNLLLSQLKDPEPFVYLNAIKNIVKMLSFDKSFLGYIIELYATSKKTIDEKLRIGEILTRFVSTHGKLLTDLQIDEIVGTCLNISRVQPETEKTLTNNNDTRMKMSSLSLLGITCHECGYGVTSYIPEIVDLVYGIITFEKSAELKRAAVVIINDIVSNYNGLEILKEYGERIQILLDYISEKDQDLLVCELASATLDQIEESFNSKFTIVD